MCDTPTDPCWWSNPNPCGVCYQHRFLHIRKGHWRRPLSRQDGHRKGMRKQPQVLIELEFAVLSLHLEQVALFWFLGFNSWGSDWGLEIGSLKDPGFAWTLGSLQRNRWWSRSLRQNYQVWPKIQIQKGHKDVLRVYLQPSWRIEKYARCQESGRIINYSAERTNAWLGVDHSLAKVQG